MFLRNAQIWSSQTNTLPLPLFQSYQSISPIPTSYTICTSTFQYFQSTFSILMFQGPIVHKPALELLLKVTYSTGTINLYSVTERVGVTSAPDLFPYLTIIIVGMIDKPFVI